jgi:hypothetical protein
MAFEYMSAVLERFKNWPKDTPIVSHTAEQTNRRK